MSMRRSAVVFLMVVVLGGHGLFLANRGPATGIRVRIEPADIDVSPSGDECIASYYNFENPFIDEEERRPPPVGAETWSLPSGRRTGGKYTGYSSSLNCRYSPDGKYLALGNGWVKFIDRKTSTTSFIVEGIGDDFEFSRDGRWIAGWRTTSDGSIVVAREAADKGKRVRLARKRDASGDRPWISLCFTAKPDELIIVSGSDECEFWNVASGKLKFVLPAKDIRKAAVSNDGKTLAMLGWDRLETWDLPTRTLRASVPTKGWSICFAANDRLVLTGSERLAKGLVRAHRLPLLVPGEVVRGDIKAWDPQTLTLVKHWAVDDSVRNLRPIPNSNRVLFSGESSYMRILNVDEALATP